MTYIAPRTPAETAALALAECASLLGASTHRSDWALALDGIETPTIADLLKAATRRGFLARTLSVAASELHALDLPAVVAWGGRYGVLERIQTNGKARLFEADAGWRTVGRAEIARLFGGQVLEFRGPNDFKAQRPASALKISSLFRWSPLVRSAASQALVLTVLVQLHAILSPLYMQSVVDHVIGQGRVDLLTTLAVGFALIAVFNAAATALRNLVLQRLTSVLGWDMTRGVMSHLLRLPPRWFEERRLADILSRVQSVDQIRTFLAALLSGSVIDGLLCLTMLGMMLWISPMLGFVALGFTALNVGVRWATVGRVMALTARSIDAAAIEQGKRIENLRAAKTIKIMTAEERREIDWSNRLSRAIVSTQEAAAATIWVAGVQTLVSGLGGVVLIYLAARMALAGHLTVGILFAFVAYQTQFATRATNVLDLVISWRTLDLHKSRVAEIVLSAPEARSEHGLRWAEHPGLSVRMSAVSFTYPGAEHPTILEADMEIPPGAFAAIIGVSGAGKSTLLKILCGLYPPTRGQVEIDGQLIRPDDATEMRRILGVVLQDDDLLSGSILENVSFFEQQPDEAWTWTCLAAAGVRDEIAALPRGLETQLGDLGSALSGGQRQRLMLARALYRRPKVLLLDEATSHLDAEREKTINLALANMEMTRIVVAHRKETVAAADIVFELRNGAIFRKR